MTDLDLTKAIESARDALQTESGCRPAHGYQYCKAHGRWNAEGNYCADMDDLADLAIATALPHIREQLANLVIDFSEACGRRGALTNVVISIRDTANLVRGKANE